MPLDHERPSPEYMLELKAVARSAGALRDHLPKVNLLPDAFPLEQVEGFCNALIRLPDGTAEGSIAPLRAADSELNRIRQRFIPAHDEDSGDAEPLVPRNSDFDLRLVGLMAAVRAAIERYKVEAGVELDTDVTPDLPENPAIEEPAAKALSALEDASQEADKLREGFAKLDDEISKKEFESEERLVSDAATQIDSTKASLSTDNPRPTVLDWLDAGLSETADEIEKRFQAIPEKAKAIGITVSGGLLQIAEAWAPVVTTLRVAYETTRQVIIILKAPDGYETDNQPSSPPPDFNYVEVYNSLLRGEPVRADWALHVTILDFGFANFHHLDEASKKRISGEGKGFSDASQLAKLENLHYLNLSETQVTDIAPLANLANLQSLNLTNTKVTDLVPLATLTNLKNLNLHATQVADVTPLATLTSLEVLSLWQTQVADLTPLASLTKLKDLNLWNTPVADLTPLASLTKLQSLDLMGTLITDLAPVANFRDLETLFLPGPISIDLAPIANLTKLRTLFLSGTQTADFSPLIHLTNMEALYLHGTNIVDLALLVGLVNLETLDLTNTPATDLTPLTSVVSLKSLDLTNTPVTDLAPLANLANLETLDLTKTPATDLTPLANLASLQFLDLSNTKVTDTSSLAHLVTAGLEIQGP